jgi:transposase-like protein
MHEIWSVIVNCDSRVPTIAREYGVSESTIYGWARGATPSKKLQPIVEKMMKELPGRPRMVKHPSYGYATPEQIELVMSMGIGPGRDRLLAQIAKQQKSSGKSK